MERAEKYGLGVAAAGHVLLFGLLSVGFLATPNPLKLTSKPIDISLVDEVSLESAAPATMQAPATSQAPDSGPPEDAAPAPSPETALVQPATPPPAPPQPRPEPARAAPAQPTVAKPAPAKPAPTRAAAVARPTPPAKPQPAKAAPAPPARATPAQPSRQRPGLSRPDVAPERAGTTASATAKRPRGSLLSDDFRKSLAISSERGTGQAPRAAAVSAQAVAGLGDAIKRQVQPCANRVPNPGPGANQINTKLRLRMKADGSLAGRPSLTGQTGVTDENQRYAQRVGELAAAAVIQCAPYKLPAELYENGWKDIIINYRLPG